MNNKVLFVDDEPLVLESFQRTMTPFCRVVTAPGPEAGLEMIKTAGPFAVVVADMQMPGMNGVEFLIEVRKIATDTVRMMLTGDAQFGIAIKAVNEGHIFRFLTKPCASKTLARVIGDGIAYYDLIQSERDLLEGTLKGSIKVIMDLLALVSPESFGKAGRLENLMGKFARKLGEPAIWEFELTGLLSHIGCLALPSRLISRFNDRLPINESEMELINRHPSIGHDLINNIPRLGNVARYIELQNKHFDGSGLPLETIMGKDIPLGARALHIALDYDELVMSGLEKREAVKVLVSQPLSYDQEIVGNLSCIIEADLKYNELEITLQDLQAGMIIKDNLITGTNSVIFTKNLEVTSASLARLTNLDRTSGIKQPFKVLVLA